jgi:hypothetical protein
MRIFAALVALLVTASSAHAISRHDMGGWSCERVKSVLQSEGAAVLRYRSPRNTSLTLYDRYVSDARYCSPDQVVKSTSIPTTDTEACAVRRCIQYEPPDMR